jgi:hypothetical protein
LSVDPDPDRPVVLSNLLTDTEAAILVAYLEGEGIAAMTAGSGGSTGWPEAARYVQVVVRHRDLDRARAAAEAMRHGGDGGQSE